MTISIEELQRKLKSISADMLPALKEAMTDAAMNIEGKAKEPGNCGYDEVQEAPFITGTMRRSISSKTEQKGNEIHGIVGAGVDYAIDVHEGTSRMEARPFILDAITEKEGDTLGFISDAVESNLRRHTR